MRRSVLGVVLALFVVIAGCSSDSGGVSVDDAWGRPSPAAAANGAFYMTITGGGEDDTLTSVTTDVCGVTELHETTMTDGSMSMRQVSEGIAVPAAATVVLEPGDLHVMCLDVGEGFVVGDSVDLELSFASQGTVSVTAEIRETGDDMGDMDHGEDG
jgi:copper(I)-binding protein